MKLDGTHKFKANRQQVFSAILNPAILKQCIPGCDSIEYLDASSLQANITTALPGLKGPYAAVIRIAQQQAPSSLVLEVQRKGRGGAINAVSQINIADEPDGALLHYSASAEMEGLIAKIVNNPLGENFTKKSLGTFFKNLDQAIV